MTTSFDILVVDDEADIRELIADIFADEGCTVRQAKNSDTALDSLKEKVPDAVILDIWLKDSTLDGLGILEICRRRYPDAPVIMISGHGNIETAVTSLRMGAYDYIEKPFKQDKLVHVVKRAVEVSRLRSENLALRQKSGSVNLLIGNSPCIQQLRQAIERVAPTGSRVFVTGPSGVGKEDIARTIHEKSRRRSGSFVVLNAGSLSSDMMDHELFGTEDGDDLNAPPRKVGVIEQANGGTLFIDEITEVPVATQGKLVRFLQDKTFERVGSADRIEADVRVIAATRKDVQEEITLGNLREDLYYRLNVVPLQAPQLKERREDIALLCDYFIAQTTKMSGLPPRCLSDDAIAALQAYGWPGNIRQLRNVIEWLLIMCPGDMDEQITSDMLPREIFSATPATIAPDVNTDIMSMKLRQAREVFERQYLIAQIDRFGGNISRTASFIGMERSALHRKLKALDLNKEEKISA